MSQVPSVLVLILRLVDYLIEIYATWPQNVESMQVVHSCSQLLYKTDFFCFIFYYFVEPTNYNKFARFPTL